LKILANDQQLVGAVEGVKVPIGMLWRASFKAMLCLMNFTIFTSFAYFKPEYMHCDLATKSKIELAAEYLFDSLK
jgi:hypothetical protein